MTRVSLLISGGRVIDPASGVDEVADVAVEAGRIVGIGPGYTGDETLDASGACVTPGFIDSHSHTDFTVPMDTAAPAKLLQGITTDITGNCGFSPFPLDAENPDQAEFGHFLSVDMEKRWSSLSTYRADLDARGLGINIAALAGLGAIRTQVMGSADRRPTSEELAAMQRCVAEAMSDGAFGVSSGLVYSPSGYADADELVSLLEPCVDAGGVYATHVRDESDGVVEAIAEAIEVGRRAGCGVQLSHHKALGAKNWGRVVDTLHAVDVANASGGEVWVDMYPYIAGSTTLASLLPKSELSDGHEAFVERVKDASTRTRIGEEIRTSAQFSMDMVMLGAVPGRPELNGTMLTKAASDAGLDPIEMVMQLVERHWTDPVMIAFGGCEPDLEAVLRHDRCLIGSDGWALRQDDANGYAHPRSFASVHRLIRKYVLDSSVLTLADAIAKMTSLPAQRFGLADRGSLQPGYWADAVVFDLDELEEGCSFENPRGTPRGIRHVVVAGEVAVRDGNVTKVKAGKVLRRTAASKQQETQPQEL